VKERRPVPKWVDSYLLVIGILLILAGISLAVRTYLKHAYPLGYLLGAGFIFYGIIRLKHRKTHAAETEPENSSEKKIYKNNP
jgi:uncharacterized membrane protein HdeD (DUF308 family)